LINNAQTFRPLSPIAEVSERDVDVFYDSGVKGTLWAMQAVYPHMRAARVGSAFRRRGGRETPPPKKCEKKKKEFFFSLSF